MAVEVDQAVPFLGVADQAFSVRSAQVRRARQASRHARDDSPSSRQSAAVNGSV
jgi:hypothetical protein